MPSSSSRSRRRMPLRRRLLYVAVILSVVCAAAETTAFLAYRIGTREWFSYDHVHTLQVEAAGLRRPTAEDGFSERLARIYRTPHPYLGFVYSPELNEAEFGSVQSRFGITPFGFIDDGSPIQKRSDEHVIVGIVGGSFALGLSLEGDAALARMLVQHPRLSGKKITFVRLCLGGYKQPQQLLTISYLLALGAEFDFVVNIDGFNEVVLPRVENVPVGVYPFFPRAWSLMSGEMLTPAQQRLLAQKTYTEQSRRELAVAFLAMPTRYSILVQSIWRFLDRLQRGEIRELDAALRQEDASGQRFVATGPGVGAEFTGENLGAELVAFWHRASVQLARLCEQNGIHYLHFLQPNQYLPDAKPMGPEERAHAIHRPSSYSRAVEAGYPLLIEEGKRLAAAGVDFHDLTMVFRPHPEPLYVDACCHVNKRGNEIVARRIGKAMFDAIDRRDAAELSGKVATKLTSAVSHLVLTDPLRPSPCAVVATFDDGAQRALPPATLAGHLSIADPQIVELTALGLLRGLRSGTTTLHIHIGGAALDLPVTVRFPAVVALGDGSPGSGGHTPTLEATAPPTAADPVVRLRLSRALGGASGVVMIAGDPEHFAGGGALLPPDSTSIPLSCGGPAAVPGAGHASIEIPLPPAMLAGPSVAFVQVVIQDAAAPYGCSVSNALRLERSR